MEHELYVGLRAQKPPLPGTRPGLPPEPEPQVRAATVGYVAAPEPLLTAPFLADTAADAMDSRTAKFLLRDALRKLEEEENWEERRKANAHLKAMTELVRRVSRKRKKRRKKKTSSWPRSTSTTAASSFWCAHRRLRQRHVQVWFFYLALCPLVADRPRCSASWPV